MTHPLTEAWYLLYGGQSVDGSGPGVYLGRTCNVFEAARHYREISDNPYSTGYIRVITDTDEEVIRYLCDSHSKPAILALKNAVQQVEDYLKALNQPEES